jgi:phospholipid/cholesterol/gamma-HCH transport system substrate-binding protein
MVFGKSKLELKVGIFVFGGLMVLAMFVFLIGKYETWTVGYRVNFTFNFVNGVKLGAPVRFAGVDVGEVKEIKCIFLEQDNKTIVKVNCWIKNDIKIPQDSNVWVNTLGLLGEKYIEVMPGKDYTNSLTENQDLAGVDPVPMQEVTELAKKIATNLDDIIAKIKNKEGTIGKLFFDDAIYNDLQGLVQDLRRNPWKLLHKPKGAKY